MDTSDDFVMPAKTNAPQVAKRTLLLSPPSLSSHQEKLTSVLQMHDRSQTDMQMLDRLAMGLVSLPEATYDVIMILSDADDSRHESQSLVSRDVLALLAKAMKPGAILHSQDGQYGAVEGPERGEAILAGLAYEPSRGFSKPDYGAQESVPLRFGKKKTAAQAAGGVNGASGGAVSLPTNGKRKSQDVSSALPAGVGFDDGSLNDLEGGSDDELIDEEELMGEDDLKKPLNIREYSESNNTTELT
jgi:anamorsin